MVVTSRFTLIGSLVVALALGCGYSKPLAPKDGGVDGTVNVGNPGGQDAGGGGEPVCLDNDGDGVPGTGDCAQVAVVDCDDANPIDFPGNAEVCDDADNDCDGAIDEELPLLDHYADGDGDGFGTGASTQSCHTDLPNLVNEGGDCNDADPLIHPKAPEACDNVDNDCNGKIDDNITFQNFYADADQDGFGAGAATSSCEPSLPGKVTKNGDCNDNDATVHPGATEQCNGKDDDCNGSVDESFPNKNASCQTGLLGPCAPGTFQCVGAQEKCVGNVMPSIELCDGIDNNCDGAVDEAFSNKGATCSVGQGVCAASGAYVCSASQTSTTCNATPGTPTAAACDGQDNDCDGQVDETELTRWWNTSSDNPTDLDVTPFFITTSSCNGGQGSSGTDAWNAFVMLGTVGGSLHATRLDSDGRSVTSSVNVSSFSSYTSPAIAQAGTGFVAGGIYNGTDVDLYYFGTPAPNGTPTPRQIDCSWCTYPSSGPDQYATIYTNTGASISSLRIVRGNGGRFVVLWREASGGTSKIRMARLSLTGSGPYTLNSLTATKDLVTVAAPTKNFGAASSHEEYGDTVGCPQGNARFGLAHIVTSGSAETLKLDVFNEDGTAAGSSYTVFSSASGQSIFDPDVAWVNQGGDRWAVAHAVSTSTSPASAAVYFWQSAQSGQSTVFGSSFTGNGTSSASQVKVVSRSYEWMISAAAYGSATSSQEPQIYVGKKGFTGTTVMPLTQVTPYSGCTGTNCSNGTRKLPRAMPNDSGASKGAGAVLFGGSSGDTRAGVLGCN